MKHYVDTVMSGNPLRAVSGASVQVNHAGGSAATLYSDRAGSVLLANPVTTNARGAVDFYAPNELYDLIYSGTNLTTLAVPNVDLTDPPIPGPLYVGDYGAVGGGVTDDSVAILRTITAVVAQGGGTVLLGPLAYNIGTTTIVIPNTVNLVGCGYGTTLLYAGTGSAVRLSGAQFATVGSFGVVTSHDAGSAIEAGTATRQSLLTNISATGTNAATTTGAGFYLNAISGFSGGLVIHNCNVTGAKYGVKFQSVNLSTDTWTAVDITSLWVVGRAAGVVAGSAGIYFDANTNGIGTKWRGGTIESFALGVQHLNGGFGADIECDFEGNTADVSVGASFTGRIATATAGTITVYGGPLNVKSQIAIGPTPAHVGGVRLSNSGGGTGGQVYARNGGDSADIPVLELFSDNHIYMGAGGTALVGGGVTNSQDLGLTGARWKTVYVGTSVVAAGFYEGTEMTAPTAGAVNTGRLYFDDSGGKTRLMVIFNTGAAQQVAIQP